MNKTQKTLKAIIVKHKDSDADKRVYIDAADVAKIIRAKLADNFPGQTFYVRTSKYSMGASINVRWIDGPSKRDVEALADMGSKGLMDITDYVPSNDHWLLPDGTFTVARRGGSFGRDSEDYERPHKDARRVFFSSDHVFCERSFTKEAAATLASMADPYNQYEYTIKTTETTQFGKEPVITAYAEFEHWNQELNFFRNELYRLQNEHSFYDAPAQAEAVKTDNQQPPSAPGAAGYTVEHERDWTWIKFESKPDDATRETLSKELGARWSHKRMAWYIREPVSAETIAAAIGRTAAPAEQPAAVGCSLALRAG